MGIGKPRDFVLPRRFVLRSGRPPIGFALVIMPTGNSSPAQSSLKLWDEQFWD